MLKALVFLIAVVACAAARAETIVALWDPAYVALRPGAHVQLMVIAKIRPGHAVIARQAGSEDVQRLFLRMRPARNVSLGAPLYPRGVPVEGVPGEQGLLGHIGMLRIAVPVTIAARTPTGQLVLSGELHYQSCDRYACSAPQTLPVRIPIDVQPGARD